MPAAARPGALRHVWFGVSGGLCGGSAAGVGESLYLLSTTTPSEYQALLYGAVLYGLAGVVPGLVVGLALATLGRALGVSSGRAWCTSFALVAAPLGAVLVRERLDKAVYAEAGVPGWTLGCVVGGFLLLGLLIVWIGTNLLTKTPLKVLPTPKGTVAAWGGLVGLCFLFSRAEPPGVAGDRTPHRAQTTVLAAKPNVLLVVVDSLRADALGVYGQGPTASPAVDRLAADAVVFDQAIAAAPWTRPSFASLLTSAWPSSHRCETKDAALDPRLDTLAEVLQRNGYATLGLPDNPNVTATLGFGQGFDWYPYEPQYPLGAAESSYSLSLYTVARRAWARLNPRKDVHDSYAPAEEQLARATAAITAQGDDRWFLLVHLMEPHDPYFAHPYDGRAVARVEDPTPDPARLDEIRALYAGEVRHVDGELGRFFDGLRAAGVYDDALIVLTADHGEELQDHGGWWHGTTLFDEVVHVPLLVKLPGGARAGTRVPWQVRLVDVAPTLADLVRVEVGADWVGEPLFTDDFDDQLARLRPPVPPAPDWSNHPASRPALSEANFEGYDLQALRTDGRKLVETLLVPDGAPRRTGAACFDVRTDPHETHDLAGNGSDCEAALAQRLHDLVARAAASAVDAPPLSDAERARLDALGYGPVAAEPAEGAEEAAEDDGPDPEGVTPADPAAAPPPPQER